MLFRTLGFGAALCALALTIDSSANAQQPYPPQPYPPPPPPGVQPYPPQPQPYPPPAQPYPPPNAQPYPGQPYPPPAQPYPPPGAQPYPPQPGQPYPPQPGQPYPPPGAQPYPPQPGQPYPPPAPAQPQVYRNPDEMTFLYLTSAGYGIGSGIWFDALVGLKDPGLDIIAPIILGAGAPIGVYFVDRNYEFHRGVPASISTGLLLGAVEGMGIDGVQWQFTRGDSKDWSFQTQTTIAFLTATGGGLGGYAFGEWLKPDPRSLGFIASGAGWGAISGTLFGGAITTPDWKDGGSVAGLIGYNAGIVSTGAISLFYTPSWQSQKWMWAGYGIGTLAGCVVYPFYLAGGNAQHGLIANSLGGLAGLAVAGALTSGLRDSDQTAKWTPPFQFGVGPMQGGGAVATAYGVW